MSALNELPLAAYPLERLGNTALAGPYTSAAARTCCWMAQLAYEGERSKIEGIAAQWGYAVQPLDRRVVSPLPLTETKGLVLGNDTTVILSFAGTDPLNFANWVTDFNWLPRSGDLHTGFRVAADAAWDDARAAAAAATSPKSLIITGHSLGAAIATLIANRLQREANRTADAVYLFGAPRAGGRGLAAEYGPLLASRTFRLVHGGDIVPTVPPPALGFHHVGQYLACARFTKFDPTPNPDTTSDAPELVEAAIADVRVSLGSLFAGQAIVDPSARANGLIFPALPPGIGDHLPDRYLLALT
jgi:triacylglycerol lipase